MVRADIAIAVRRCTTTGVVMSLKCKQRSWHRWRRQPNVFEVTTGRVPGRRLRIQTRRLLPRCSLRGCRVRRSFLEFLLLARRKEAFADPDQDGPVQPVHHIRSSVCRGRPARGWTDYFVGRALCVPWANSATAMPRRQSTEAVKMRRLKKADFEVDFFFMNEVEFFPLR